MPLRPRVCGFRHVQRHLADTPIRLFAFHSLTIHGGLAAHVVHNGNMIADRRFVRSRPDARLTAAIALGATLVIGVFGALLYSAFASLEVQQPFFHCDKLLDRADGAEPAEKVRLLQEYYEAYCD